MIHYTATYSPDDNKLRLTASQRLDAETYARVKAAGYRWAPKQEQFIAPMWTPAREDLALELAGEITDEDSTLAERAEARAERFDTYSEKRMADANRAADAVAAIADNIPLGQPILIGHHSERHARRDAERIESGMRKAVKMWETSEYWTRRAAAALDHAAYKERPDVRARRISTLEAEQRKMQRGWDDVARKRNAWTAADSREKVLHVANNCHLSMCFPLAKYPRELPVSQYEGQMGFWSAVTDGVITWEHARELALKAYSEDGRSAEHYRRWKAHYENRLAYERAMLGTAGGLPSDQVKPEKGGAVKCWVTRGGYEEIVKVNQKTVTIMDDYGNGGRRFARNVEFADLTEVKSRAEWLAMQGKPADTPPPKGPTLPPLCNYRTDGCLEMTAEQWKRRTKVSDFAHVRHVKATETRGAHRQRTDMRGGEGNARWDRLPVFIIDAPVKEAPPPAPAEQAAA